jgi:hypothetical protein
MVVKVKFRKADHQLTRAGDPAAARWGNQWRSTKWKNPNPTPNETTAPPSASQPAAGRAPITPKHQAEMNISTGKWAM